MDRRRFLALAGSAAAAGLLPSAAAAAPLKLGDFEVTVLSDGFLALPPSFLATNAPAAERDAIIARTGDPAQPVRSAINVTLIRTPDDLILVDTGAGPNFMDSAGKLEAALEAAGIDREAVTRVIYTHAHPDHLWGTIDDLDDLRFPNAACYVSAAEWDFWMGPDILKQLSEDRHAFAAGAQRNFKRIEPKVEMVKPGQEILPGLRVIDTAGHTPGHVSVEIAAGGESLVVLGDALTHPVVSFEHPDWKPASDHDPDRAVETRRHLLDRLAADRSRIVGYHLPHPGTGIVERKGSAWVYRPLA